MSDDRTPNMALPYLYAGQAQKEITHNEALLIVDLLLSGTVEAVGETEVPATPVPGQCWIVGAGAGGAWTGRADAVAAWTTGGWRFLPPGEGRSWWSRADAMDWRYRDGAWRRGEIAASTVSVDGLAVLGPRQPAIAPPAGGATVDAEARAAIAAILATLEAHGLVAAG